MGSYSMRSSQKQGGEAHRGRRRLSLGLERLSAQPPSKDGCGWRSVGGGRGGERGGQERGGQEGGGQEGGGQGGSHGEGEVGRPTGKALRALSRALSRHASFGGSSLIGAAASGWPPSLRLTPSPSPPRISRQQLARALARLPAAGGSLHEVMPSAEGGVERGTKGGTEVEAEGGTEGEVQVKGKAEVAPKVTPVGGSVGGTRRLWDAYSPQRSHELLLSGLLFGYALPSTAGLLLRQITSRTLFLSRAALRKGALRRGGGRGGGAWGGAPRRGSQPAARQAHGAHTLATHTAGEDLSEALPAGGVVYRPCEQRERGGRVRHAARTRAPTKRATLRGR